jgi:hypothetical protein
VRASRLLPFAALLCFAPGPRAGAGVPVEVDLVDTTEACADATIGVVIGEFGAPSVDRALGFRFTVEAEGVWRPTELVACVSTEGSPHSREFTLRVDDGGLPGEEMYFFTMLVPTSPALTAAPANVRPVDLEFGQAYWLVAEAGFTSDTWWLPLEPTATAPMAESIDGAPFQVIAQEAFVPQLRLHAVPEPASAAGPAVAIAALLLARRRRRARAALRGVAAAAFLLAMPAVAAERNLVLTDLGTYTAESLTLCGVGIFVEGNDVSELSLGPLGLGVDGPLGALATDLDGNESIVVYFGLPGATEIDYAVIVAGNENGSGAAGDAFVEAFTIEPNSSPVSLGVEPVSGIGTKSLTALFGNLRISFIRITASGDSQRIAGFRFTPAPGAESGVDFRSIGNFQGASFARCGVEVSGSADIFLSSLGLGVLGPVGPSALNGSEWLEVHFESPQQQVVYVNEHVADVNGNGTQAEGFLQAFDAGGASLGVVAVSGAGLPIDVTGLFDGAVISGFRLTANADAQLVTTLAHAPEPGAGGLAAVAFCVVLALRACRARAARAPLPCDATEGAWPPTRMRSPRSA